MQLDQTPVYLAKRLFSFAAAFRMSAWVLDETLTAVNITNISAKRSAWLHGAEEHL